MSNLNVIIFILSSLILASCITAPLTTPKSARSLGKEKWSVDLSLEPFLSFSAATGLTDDLDLGLLIENFIPTTLGLWTRYSIINSKDGFSLGAFGGGFLTIYPSDSSIISDGSNTLKGFYVGPIISYRGRVFEPHFSVRYNYVNIGNGIINKDNSSTKEMREALDIDDNNSYSYLQFTLGANFWVKKDLALTLDGKVFSSKNLSKFKLTYILPGFGILMTF